MSVADKSAVDKPAAAPLLFLATNFGKGEGNVYTPSRKVYYINVTTDGEAILRLRPAKDENGAATLYDEVSGACLPVVNGGGFTVGNDVDATQVSIDEGLSGNGIAVPSDAAVSLSGGKLVVNGKAYEPKAHYVFKEVTGGYALEIAPEEAVVDGFEIAADGIVSVTSDKAFGNFWYALEHAGTPLFSLSSRTPWQKLTADERTLTAQRQGDQRFYRLLVTDRPE